MEQADAGARGSASARFLAFCGEPASLRQWLLALIPGVDPPERLNRILDCADLVVYASPETPFASLRADRGVVLGDPLEHQACRGAARLPSSTVAIYAAVCAELEYKSPLDGCAVFLRTGDGVSVLRGSSGAIAVHHVDAGNVAAFFSHAGLVRQLGRRLGDGSTSSGPEQVRICELEPGEVQRVNTATAKQSL